MLLMLFCVALAVSGIGYAKYRLILAGIAMGKSFAPPPAAVTTLKIQSQIWSPALTTIGSIKAIQGVTITTDLVGIVSEIRFESGQSIKKGQPLVLLQSDQENAQLHAADARRHLAEITLARKLELQAKSALAPTEIDSAESELQQASAAVEQAAALLARKQITAPFDGVLGLRQISLGQLLNPGTPIVTMHSIDPMRVQFTLPQHQLQTATPGNSIRILAQGTGTGSWTGKITALDSQLNDASRSITIEGTIPNPDGSLRQGMFVNIELPLQEESSALVVPASAVSYAPYGDSVYVIKDSTNPDGKSAKIVEQQFVKIGDARGDQVRILSGLKPGDEIVTSGVFKLRPGAAVQINNSVQPSNSPTPKPPNT